MYILQPSRQMYHISSFRFPDYYTDRLDSEYHPLCMQPVLRGRALTERSAAI